MARSTHTLVVAFATVTMAAASALPAAAGEPPRNHFEAAGGFDAAGQGVGLGVVPDPTDPANQSPGGLTRGVPSYGYALVRYGRDGLGRFRNASLVLEFNTDTVAAALSAWNVGVPGLGVGVFARAEALLAGVLLNHLRDGVNVTRRGFAASYALGGGRISYTVLQHLTFEGELGARGWAFTRIPGRTDPHLRMPSNHVTAEPRLRIKWLDLRMGRADLGLPNGLGMVLEVAADARWLNRPWGNLDGEKVEARNDVAAGAVARRALGNFVGGMRVLRRLHLHGTVAGGWGEEEDDITRPRLGGMNPYTVNIPGAAWGEFLSERYVAASMHAGLVPAPLLYVGVGVHAAMLNDPRRVGSRDELGFFRGVTAEARMAFFQFLLARVQVGGNLDVVRPGGRGALGAIVSVEQGFDL